MKFNNLRYNICNNFPFYLNVIFTNKVLKPYWGSINRLKAKWWGVKLGNKISFVGTISYRKFGNSTIEIGNNCTFLSSHNSNWIGVYTPCILSTIADGAQLVIGNNCGFSGTVIGSGKSIKIGNNVRCGANTLITDSDWHLDDLRVGEDKPIIIEDNVWLGYGVKVLKGVHIGENTVIGAGSIVTKSIPANVIAAGNPCKVIKSINL